MNRPADCAEPFSSVNAMSMAGSEVLGKAVRLAQGMSIGSSYAGGCFGQGCRAAVHAVAVNACHSCIVTVSSSSSLS